MAQLAHLDPVCQRVLAARGITSAGQVDYRIDDMHCDYFAGSPHKWLFAPAGSGILYIRAAR